MTPPGIDVNLTTGRDGSNSPGRWQPIAYSTGKAMDAAIPETIKSVCMSVNPGICGFPCRILVRKNGRKTATVEILSCECKQIRRLSEQLSELSLKDLFLPLSRNPVYVAAEKSGCHASCGIPVAIVKAGEVAMGMALPMDVEIRFHDCTEPSHPAPDFSNADRD